MFAQAGVIAGICMAGAYSVLESSQKSAKSSTSVVNTNNFRETFVRQPAAAAPAAPAAATTSEIKE
jgi:hypothetical protein